MKQYSGDIDVVEICTDDLAEVAEEAGVVSIPTIQFYYGGSPLETHSIVGCVAKTVLANAVEKVLEDVQQIRRK
jgi:thioredoxin-like negative regulator of GroEL